MSLSNTDKCLFAAHGWTVEHEQPLRIRHDESGSYATLLAAHAVLGELRADWDDAPLELPAARLTLREAFERLSALESTARRHCDRAASTGSEDGQSAEASEAWQAAYELVFGEELSGEVSRACERLNRPLRWVDPRAGYEADTRAYCDALTKHVADLGSSLA